MPARLSTAAWLAAAAALTAYLVYAFVIPPPWAAPSPQAIEQPSAPAPSPPAIALAQTFTAAGVSFDYPAGWSLERLNAPRADVVAALLPPEGRQSGTAIVLVVSRDPRFVNASKPIVEPGATVHRKAEYSIAGRRAWLVDWSGVSPNGPYAHGLSLQVEDDGRHVALAATISGPAGERSAVDQRFNDARLLFESVLASLAFGGL